MGGVAAAIAAYSLVIHELRRPDPVAPPGAEAPAVAKSIDDEPALPPTEPVTRDALSNDKSAAGQSLAEPSTEDSLESERARLPQEFDVVFGEPISASPLSLIHARFMHEPRDESWAIAMESGINQAVVRSDVTDPLTIEHVEYRMSNVDLRGCRVHARRDETSRA